LHVSFAFTGAERRRSPAKGFRQRADDEFASEIDNIFKCGDGDYMSDQDAMWKMGESLRSFALDCTSNSVLAGSGYTLIPLYAVSTDQISDPPSTSGISLMIMFRRRWRDSGASATFRGLR